MSFEVIWQAFHRHCRHMSDFERTITKAEYATAELSSESLTSELKEAVRQLMPEYDPMLDPEVFLASVSKNWKPRVIAVKNGDEIVGIAYAKERVLFGMPTGIISIDESLDSAIVVQGAAKEEILSLAIRTLANLRRALKIHAKIPSGLSRSECFLNRRSIGAMDIVYIPVKDHAHLPLPSTYDGFLNSLGTTSRHNFRYYRRRFEVEGHRYVPQIPSDALRSIVRDLETKCAFPSETGNIERFLKMVSAAATPLAAGLQHASGEWLSVAAGCLRPRQALLFFQVNNDRKFARNSLSVVLRSYLIESLIGAGYPELVVVGGTAPPLSRYAHYPSNTEIHLDRPIYGWRAVRSFSRMIGPHLPKRLGHYALRIAPDNFRSGAAEAF
jgi:hypothetical protein